MKKYLKTVFVFALLITVFSCRMNLHSPENSAVPGDIQQERATVRVVIPALNNSSEPQGAVKRTVKPNNTSLVAAEYYTVTLTSLDDDSLIYSGEAIADAENSVEINIQNVKVGSYKAEAKAYLEQAQDTRVLLYEGTDEQNLNVTVSGENKATIHLKAVNKGEALTGSVKITIDWTEASNVEGVIREVMTSEEVTDMTVKFFYKNDYTSGEYKVIDSKPAEGVTSVTFTTSNIPVTGRGYGYFGIYYTKGSTEYLLLKVGGEAFQIYSNQVSEPDKAELYKVKGENIPSEIHAIKLSLGYGEDPTKDLKVSWVNTDDMGALIYDQVALVLKKANSGEILETRMLNGNEYASQNASYTFEYSLTRGDNYIVTAVARTPYGRETKEFKSNEFTPKVLVESVSIVESQMPDSYIVQGHSFKLDSVVLPSDATIKDVKWSFDDDSLFIVTPANEDYTSANLVAKKPGTTKITVTSNDNTDITYTSEKTVSIRLRPVKAPSVTENTADGGKSLVVSWTPEDAYATSYGVYRYVNGVLEEQALSVINVEDDSDFTFIDKNLYANTSYAYAVKSMNESLKTETFNPESELSEASNTFTPVIPTITFTQPSIDSFDLRINNNDVEARDILVTPSSPQTLCIPAEIEGAVKYSWLVNNTLIKSSSVFGEVQSIILDASMDILSLRQGDANTLTLVVEDGDGNAHSKTIYFRVVSVIDTGVTIENPIVDYLPFTTKSYALNASVEPINATMQNLSYSSSDPSVASIDAKGVITINKTGEVTITVSPTYGAPSSFTFEVYNPISSAEELVKILGSATRPRLQEINSKIQYTYGAGDWWTPSQQIETSSDGKLEAASNTKGTQNQAGYIKYKNLEHNDSFYGKFIINTESEDITIRVNAKDGGGWSNLGNLGKDPLQYIGYNNQGSVTVHLPYNQGKAKIYFNNINVMDNNGEFGVELPYSSRVTVSYASVSEKLI